MKFTVNVCGQKIAYNLTEKELVHLYADQTMEMYENMVSDGDMEQGPTQDEFVARIYRDIAAGKECELELDSTVIDFVFPQSVRFMTKSAIEDIIKECWTQL